MTVSTSLNEDNFPVNVKLTDPATATAETTAGTAAGTTVSAHTKGHKGPHHVFRFLCATLQDLLSPCRLYGTRLTKKVLTLRNLRQSDAQRIEELVGFRVRGIRILFSRATNAEELFHEQQRRRTFIGVPLPRMGRRSLHTCRETPQSSSVAPSTHETKVS